MFTATLNLKPDEPAQPESIHLYIIKSATTLSSRNDILARVKAAQPESGVLPDISPLNVQLSDITDRFITILSAIGGKVYEVKSYDEIIAYINDGFAPADRKMSTLPALASIAEPVDANVNPHSLYDVELAVIAAQFGVAENGAVWITHEENTGVRVLPFICQHLAVVLKRSEIVSTMHAAYDRIGNKKYSFGAFIAGPSKTADIEQSLVLGAHGPKSMHLFLLDETAVL